MVFKTELKEELLFNLYKEKNIKSVTHLAIELDLSRGFVSQILTGTKSCSPLVALIICNYCDISMIDYFKR